MELLSELHEKVKNHPYRLGENEDLLKDYKDLLNDFSTVSLIEISKKSYKGVRLSDGMWHDFNASILGEDTIHIERCINYIHKFINTGKFEEFCTYYTGWNIEKGVSRLRKYEFDERTNSFIPIFTKDEMDITLKSFDEKISKCKDNIWKKYEERRKAYYIDVKMRLLQRGDIEI